MQLCYFEWFWKNQEIYRELHWFFFNKKPKFWTFRENLLYRLHSASNWLLLAVFNKTQEFLRIPNLVFEIPFFVTCSEISLSLSHPTANLLPLSLFWKMGFFSEKTHPFFKENNHFPEVLWTCTFSVALKCNFATSDDSEKTKNFFENSIYFFFKRNPILERFEKSYKVGCILHQIGCF